MKSTTGSIDISKSIRISMIKKGLSGNDLSKLAGISSSHLSLLRSGKRDTTIGMIKRIAKATGYSELDFIILGI